MPKEILIQIQPGEKRVAIIEGGKLDDFLIEVDRHQMILGNIYKGRVESILPSINGAFVDIGQERNGFLYLTDAINPLLEEEISSPLKFIDKIFSKKETEQKNNIPKNGPAPFTKGQEVLVQVVKEPFGSKGARLTTHISLAGRFVVYMPFDDHLGVSKKIGSPEERKRLRETLQEFKFAKSGGFIVRTVSNQQSKDDLLRDGKVLCALWQKIKKKATQERAPATIYKEYDLMWKVVRDYLTGDVDKLVIDSQEDYIKVRKFVDMLIGREMVTKVEYYKDTVPLFEAKKVSHELDKIYNTKVYFKSGAYIVIEQTEGLTVVDVNSGKFRTSASPEEAAFMVNLEAASEIARQLRLRDLGGIIVIDFIDMMKDSHKRKVLEALQTALAKDHSKTEVNRISPLGLVEMTRARTGKTVESISFGLCPYCDGRGRVRIS